MSVTRFFITGTDTGIGKTVVSTVLAVGSGANYWKPVQTGNIEGSDSDFLRAWIGHERVVPEVYSFPEPLSPHRAAELNGAEIELPRILAESAGAPKELLIEGAGGILVPLNKSKLMIDLVEALAIPAIVVTSTRLGTINHTLLTLAAIRSRNLAIAGVISVGEENSATIRAIEYYGGVQILGHIPRCDAFSKNWFSQTYQRLSLRNQERKNICTTL